MRKVNKQRNDPSRSSGSRGSFLGALLCCSIFHVSFGSINLEYRPANQGADIGETVNFGLYAVSDDPGGDQSFSAIQTIISWDQSALRLLGIDQSGAVDLLSSDFPDDPCGLNEANPPQDGDGIHIAMANLGEPILATPEGVLITTFQFEVLPVKCSLITAADILPASGDPECETIVFDGETPNTNVTGSLSGAFVTIASCPGDSNLDGSVNVSDLLAVIGGWGPCPAQRECCPGDVDHNTIVNVSDLLNVISAWGVCPPEAVK